MFNVLGSEKTKWSKHGPFNLARYVPLVVSTSRSFPRSWLITGFVTRITRRVSLVEQQLPILPVHLSSPPAFNGVRVTRSLVLYVLLYFLFWPLCCLFFFDIDSDYPFDVFKLFLSKLNDRITLPRNNKVEWTHFT